MTGPQVDNASTADTRASARAMLWVVFLLLFVFSYSEEIIGLLFDLVSTGAHNSWRTNFGWRMLVVAIEIVVLLVVGLKKRAIGRIDGTGPRLWPLWWTGFGVLIILDLVLSELPFRPSVWVLLAASVVIAATMGTMMATSLNADPRVLFSADRRAAHPTDWRRARAVVPLVLGTFACYLAAIAYNRSLDVDSVRTLPSDVAAQIAALPLAERLGTLEIACESAVGSAYFNNVVAVIPLLLLTLGVEFNFFRRNLRDPAQRATTAATVTVLSAALVFALSTLPFDGQGCNDMLSDWHEFLTFVITAQGISIGLITLVWLLVSSSPDDDGT
ncbi:hypothetical protein [Mycobacterium sp. 155]|uniref:hypothetical protein n=1 Tax=Mycobacterium sp. 155 TaxID=1157943 RepID=UPI000364C7D1|nr:hypothetical protein [Mycobacterium sp. 155]